MHGTRIKPRARDSSVKAKKWLLVWYIKYQQIYEKLLPLPQRREQCGMILRHSHAMSGSAGLSPSRSRKQENIISSEHARSFSKESADHVVGPVALIAYLVPYVEDEEEIFLKTIIPSRKATEIYFERKSK